MLYLTAPLLVSQVTINVLDENDNAPKLVRDTFDISLPENIPVGSTLISIVASDPDLDENRTISFTMQSGDSDCGFLSLTDTHTHTHTNCYVIAVVSRCLIWFTLTFSYFLSPHLTQCSC